MTTERFASNLSSTFSENVFWCLEVSKFWVCIGGGWQPPTHKMLQPSLCQHAINNVVNLELHFYSLPHVFLVSESCFAFYHFLPFCLRNIHVLCPSVFLAHAPHKRMNSAIGANTQPKLRLAGIARCEDLKCENRTWAGIASFEDGLAGKAPFVMLRREGNVGKQSCHGKRKG